MICFSLGFGDREQLGSYFVQKLLKLMHSHLNTELYLVLLLFLLFKRIEKTSLWDIL